MAIVVTILEDGRHVCPFCDTAYMPKHSTKERAMEVGDAESREQWDLGVCCTACWDSTFAGEEDEEDGMDDTDNS